MKTETQDFARYQELQIYLRTLIREGKFNYQIFTDGWEESEAIKSKYDGIPPVPEDWDAYEQDQCEKGVELGLR